MNVPIILAVRDHLTTLSDERFDMTVWYDANTVGELNTACGTAACIAGWTCALLAPNTPFADIPMTAQRLLGLDTEQANDLFLAMGISFEAATREVAINVLTHLAKTGDVRWTRFA